MTVAVVHRARARSGGRGRWRWFLARAGAGPAHGRHRPAAERPEAVAEVTESVDGVGVEWLASARKPRPGLLPRRPA